LRAQTVDEIVDQLLALPENTRLMILAPVVRGRKGVYRDLLTKLQRKGYLRVRVDGELYEIEEVPDLDRYRAHTIEVVVDRLILREGIRGRLAESVETALQEAEGVVRVVIGEEERLYSESLMCPTCGFSMPEPEPRLFSFNSPYGACPRCTGIGVKIELDARAIVHRPEASILGGALKPLGSVGVFWERKLTRLAGEYGVNLDLPWKDLPESFRNLVLYGTEDVEDFDLDDPVPDVPYWEGVIPYLWRRYHETESDWVRQEVERYMVMKPCPACGGARLRPEALAVTVGGRSIWDVSRMTVSEARVFLEHLDLSERERTIAHQILRELVSRLSFLENVGLDYLTLERRTESLSGGEDQRVRLAGLLGSGLTGVLYILDEPSIGLHPRDMHRLLHTLQRLRDLGNTVVVVEHDRSTMEAADWILDLGPGAGRHGGEIVAEGPPDRIKQSPRSLTGQYLSGRREIPLPESRRSPGERWLVLEGVRTNNLKNITARFPLGLLVVVTGVSGSGKSSLVEDTLYRALRQHLHHTLEPPGPHDALHGLEYIDKVINIDQTPIGRTPRSNPATYTGVFTPIRELFAATPEARMRGYAPGRFSFNVKGGRCEACRGDGYVRIEMQFLPDVYVPCEVCKGLRYNRETLEVRFKGKTIADVLAMTVDEAYAFFQHFPQIERRLRILREVGLGYLQLGQPAPTLSGGEAQRIKLARELSRVPTGKTLYILDEPTTGLHFEDVRKLIQVLRKLTEGGNTVIVIEHNLDVIKSADWVIDLGPEGGDRGGEIVAEGPPEEIARHPESHTGRYLREVLNPRRRAAS
jgi:excinuclease ABC subunit A